MVGLVGFVTVRHFMTPKSFGVVGHYRHDAISEFMVLPVMHGGKESCQKCHEELFAENMKGKHAPVSCEVCHAPLSVHVRDGKKIAEMPKPEPLKTCGYCHQKLAGRPDAIKQVVFREHAEQQGLARGAAISERFCIKCHNPHSPAIE